MSSIVSVCYQPLDEEQLAAFEELGNSFREADYPLVDGARLVLDLLAEAGHKLVLLTQGGYDEQKYKVELHNLNEYFAEIIVVDKKHRQFTKILCRDMPLHLVKPWLLATA